jgi:hypothetical protein
MLILFLTQILEFFIFLISMYMPIAPSDPQNAISSVKKSGLPCGLKIMTNAHSRIVIVILAINSILYKSFLFIMIFFWQVFPRLILCY